MNPLARQLENYLQLRRQLGFKLRVSGMLLGNFVRFAKRKRAGFITTQLALEWATHRSHLQPVQKAKRLSTVRGFARYMSAIDLRTEVPPRQLLPYHVRRRDPYLYGRGDILRLIAAARQIDPRHPMEGASHATLIGLLAVTGMRVGEALGLDRHDVDLTHGLLTIRHAKGDKSRLVPLHRSSQQALRRYAELRDAAFPRALAGSFFVSKRGTRLRYETVQRCFLGVTRRLGLRPPGARRGPRLHDLRHHFAIQSMLRWYRSSLDVEAHLPELSTYLGHQHVRDTYWYLSAVPELLRLATQRCQRKEAVE